MKETRDRTTTSQVSSLLTGSILKPISSLRFDAEPDGIERYGYRSFDRQWVIADSRIADYPRPCLWDVRGPNQVFLTTLTSTRLGVGPAVTATSYVPDLDHFSGRGAKNVIPLFRDRRGHEANVTAGLLNTLSESLTIDITAEALVAYVYGLTGTSAFTERFIDELEEGAGPVRIPLTAEGNLFSEVAALGKELLWLHTWGERCGNGSDLPTGSAAEAAPITSYPQTFRWEEASQSLQISDGVIATVAAEVWGFEVSGLKVVQSWLGYRMQKGKGKKSTPLDDIRPERWTFTTELLTLLAIVERTVALAPRAATLLDRVVGGRLVDPSLVFTPTDAERKPPKE